MYVLNVNVMQMTQKGAILAIMHGSMSQEEFEETKGVFRISKSQKDRQHYGQGEKEQNDL